MFKGIYGYLFLTICRYFRVGTTRAPEGKVRADDESVIEVRCYELVARNYHSKIEIVVFLGSPILKKFE